MTNILFIAFEFPPLNRGGVHRSLAFVRFLPQFGINPIVITLAPESYEHTFDAYGYDETLGKETRDNTTILPAKAGKPIQLSRVGQFVSIYFSIHGNETDYWKEDFNKVAAEAIRQHNIKAVFATVPPFSVLPLATELAEQHKLPLILDFRDAWSQWRTVPYGTIGHYWANLFYEGKYFKKAAAIIATSGETLADFKKLHASVDSNKFHYVPNGYNGELAQWKDNDVNKDEIVIGYVGSFYFNPEAREQMLKPWWKKRAHRMLQYIPQKQDWLYRSPHFFFEALRQLKETSPELAKKIKVRFVGKKTDWLNPMIEKAGLDDSIEQLGELPHAKAMAFQQDCDLLLITSAKRIGGKDYSIAGKTFEYIQSQKPILAFVCDGSQKDILADSGMALMCNPDDTAGSAQIIKDYITGKTTLTPNYTFIKTLSRQYLTEQLAGIIQKAIPEHN
jgi:hypothetical protein